MKCYKLNKIPHTTLLPRITYWKLYDSSSFLTIISCSCEWIGIPISRQSVLLKLSTLCPFLDIYNSKIIPMTSCKFLRIFNALKREKYWRCDCKRLFSCIIHTLCPLGGSVNQIHIRKSRIQPWRSSVCCESNVCIQLYLYIFIKNDFFLTFIR